MTTPALEKSKVAVLSVFPLDRPEGQVCALIFDRLEQLADDFEGVTLGEVASELSWFDEAKTTAIVAALDYLALSDVHLLDRHFELFEPSEDAEVLQTPVETFSDSEIRRALSQGYLVDKNGTRIEDFLDCVHIRYVVSDAAREMSKSKR